MLQRLAQPFEDRSLTRGLLLLLGVVGTVLLAPIALFGASSGIVALLFYSQAPDSGMGYRMGAIGAGGLVGLVAAWCRVLLSNRWFRQSSLLFYFTLAGLLIGIATAVLFFGRSWVDPSTPIFWFSLIVVLLAMWLLGATVGARRMRPNLTVEPDAQDVTARGSP